MLRPLAPRPRAPGVSVFHDTRDQLPFRVVTPVTGLSELISIFSSSLRSVLQGPLAARILHGPTGTVSTRAHKLSIAHDTDKAIDYARLQRLIDQDLRELRALA